MDKVLITGGSGFIGSNLCAELVKDFDVTVLDDLSEGDQSFIKDLPVHLIVGDILDKTVVNKAVKGVDMVFHLAASADIIKSAKDTRLDLDQNIVGTWNVLDAMHKNKVRKLVFASSSAVYGEIMDPEPLTETFGSLCPINLYGASKLAGEGMITAYCHLYGFSALIYRFANIVGKNQHRGVIVNFLEYLKKDPKRLQTLGDGKQLKSYTSVYDCVSGILHNLSQLESGKWDIYNIGTWNVITVDKIAEIIIDELELKNVKVTHKNEIFSGAVRGWPGDTRQCLLSIDKLKGSGWSPKFSCEDAVRQTVRHIRGTYFD